MANTIISPAAPAAQWVIPSEEWREAFDLSEEALGVLACMEMIGREEVLAPGSMDCEDMVKQMAKAARAVSSSVYRLQAFICEAKVVEVEVHTTRRARAQKG